MAAEYLSQMTVAAFRRNYAELEHVMAYDKSDATDMLALTHALRDNTTLAHLTLLEFPLDADAATLADAPLVNTAQLTVKCRDPAAVTVLAKASTQQRCHCLRSSPSRAQACAHPPISASERVSFDYRARAFGSAAR